MLPSHLLDPTKKKNDRLNQTRFGDLPPPPPPSLCVTGAMSRIGRYKVSIEKQNRSLEEKNDRSCKGGSTRQRTNRLNIPENNAGINDNNGVPVVLSYCIFRPRQLHDDAKPPLLCLHGGPSIPSNYLLPIVNGVTDRAVIFYDQWGCGKSSRPQPIAETSDLKSSSKARYPPFSIPTMVEHLRQLIEEHWKLKRFHLLGHSFGGILAYEYTLTVKKQQESSGPQNAPFLCSLILSSAPTSAKLIQSESERLLRGLTNSDGNNDTNVIVNGTGNAMLLGEERAPHPLNEGQTKQPNETVNQSMKYSEEFHQTHECRLPNLPLSLMDSLAQMGPVAWRGIQAIDGYEAGGRVDSYKLPVLLMRGEYDFCTELCMKGWKERFLFSPSNDGDVELEEKVLSNCSHYAMLEDEKLYGAGIQKFLMSHDDHR